MGYFSSYFGWLRGWHIVLALFVISSILDLTSTIKMVGVYGWGIEGNPVIYELQQWGLVLYVCFVLFAVYVLYKFFTTSKKHTLRYIFIAVMFIGSLMRIVAAVQNFDVAEQNIDPDVIDEAMAKSLEERYYTFKTIVFSALISIALLIVPFTLWKLDYNKLELK